MSPTFRLLVFKILFSIFLCGSLTVVSLTWQDTSSRLGDLPKNQSEPAGHTQRLTEFEDEFEETIQPLLEEFCMDCHAPGDMQGLDFMAAETADDLANMRYLYASVVEQMESGSMPPNGYDRQPTKAERKQVVNWLKQELELKPSDTDRIAPYVVEVYEDQNGNLWFGTMARGTARYDGESLTYFTQENGLPANAAVTSFAEDAEGTLWVGTQNGVRKFDGEAFATVGTAEGLPVFNRPSPRAWSGVTTDRDGNIWASVGQKVYRLTGESFQEFKTPIDPTTIKSFAILPGDVSFQLQDKEGNLWFSADGDGAYKFDGTNFTHLTKDDGLCSNNVTSIVEDRQGNLWFTCIQSFQPKMTGDGGVCRFDGKTFTHFPNVKGLSNNDIYTLFEARNGDIWIGATRVGAYRYNGEGFTLFSETNRPHWTRNFGIQGIAQDRMGTLWFGFSGGLFRFDGHSFFNVTKSGPWTDYTSAMGKAAAGDPTGSTWLHPEFQTAMAAFSKGQFEEAQSILTQLKQKQPNDPTVDERNINQTGYWLIMNNKLDAAIEVFKINTMLYPQEFNAFDSLAEAYLRVGNDELAVKNYQRSLELNPENQQATIALKKISARKRYESLLVAPETWLEEVLMVPPNFAPGMSLKGLEHLRLPPEFREPESDWFWSYLFAMELSEPAELNEGQIAEQLLIYFRGLATANLGEEATGKFTLTPTKTDDQLTEAEFAYVLNWREPFVDQNQQVLNLRVKVLLDKNKHGVLFICASPQPADSDVWRKLLEIRGEFESAETSRNSDEKH